MAAELQSECTHTLLIDEIRYVAYHDKNLYFDMK